MLIRPLADIGASVEPTDDEDEERERENWSKAAAAAATRSAGKEIDFCVDDDKKNSEAPSRLLCIVWRRLAEADRNKLIDICPIGALPRPSDAKKDVATTVRGEDGRVGPRLRPRRPTDR